MGKYETVFIDLDETLFDFKKAEEAALAGSFQEYGLELSEERAQAYERINQALWKRLEQGTIRLSELKTERFRLLFEEIAEDIDAESFGHAYVRWLSRGIYPLEGAEDICRYLSGKYRLVIITNGIREVQLPRIGNSGIASYVSATIVSEDAGSSKPDRGIFEYACRAIDSGDKARMIMLGDSLSSDIQGGINFGIDTCWTNLKGVDNPGPVVPTYEVRRLGEIKAIL